MARIAGVDIPQNKQVLFSLPYIYGIGPTLAGQILERLKIDPTVKVSALTEEELNRIREVVDKEFRVEGDLRKEISLNVKRLIDIGSYRGLRHRRSLPVNGQRTRTNARTRRGPRKTVAGRGQKRGAAKK
ncbi:MULTISPECIES: 30S ribosomal protein S13 [Dehalogenimonas]|jgi:small subunit ribosomal protein S13|uniref:Small ribosomal subunit protein uS13 n=2 Tax=Dehalogenimonas TaxID=670486 RepID=A0A0W0GFZ0_9CHLR|nr:30S ribosomal protein S13 [Dehalogenimonas alkenigignens]KTB47460.1 SSU ribosomal protein S13P [Dehalogenimonas alkenigignens]PVV83480.1 30S ribosomal protein S13 [Dehalogenimonas alkenigignens]